MQTLVAILAVINIILMTVWMYKIRQVVKLSKEMDNIIKDSRKRLIEGNNETLRVIGKYPMGAN